MFEGIQLSLGDCKLVAKVSPLRPRPLRGSTPSPLNTQYVDLLSLNVSEIAGFAGQHDSNTFVF